MPLQCLADLLYSGRVSRELHCNLSRPVIKLRIYGEIQSRQCFQQIFQQSGFNRDPQQHQLTFLAK
jgi:hypothetical protein